MLSKLSNYAKSHTLSSEKLLKKEKKIFLTRMRYINLNILDFGYKYISIYISNSAVPK